MSAITGLPLTADQELESELVCGWGHATPTQPLPSFCPAFQLGSHLVKIPAPNAEQDDHNPQRIRPRHLFDVAVGNDNIFHGDKYEVRARILIRKSRLSMGRVQDNHIGCRAYLIIIRVTILLFPISYLTSLAQHPKPFWGTTWLQGSSNGSAAQHVQEICAALGYPASDTDCAPEAYRIIAAITSCSVVERFLIVGWLYRCSHLGHTAVHDLTTIVTS